MTLKEAIDFGAYTLKNSQIQRPRLESEILLSHTLNQPRIYLHSHSTEELSLFHEMLFMDLIQRRKNLEPIEYIINKVSFYGKEFYVDRGVLIPRPETEILVDKARNIITQNNCKNIAEIGIGSGIISIMLALLLPNSNLNFYASDIIPEALFNTHVNLEKFKISNVKLYKSAFLDFNKKENITFDLLISNPPYIKKGEILPTPLSFEPQKALFGGERGDEILHQIIKLAYENKIPHLICEMGYNQRESIENLMQNIPHQKLEFYQDLANLERGFIIDF
ncbi:HemK/PrmC family methyltransferase [Helicobacter canadensis]|uniref:peptide chain release factor N(5)-glutamine methyltransferase n=1 Tax=Helicobacter canadensis MIT 98-5491 TaxID=537970 RepID=C5ZXY5_9HELI|nr:HemK/PrmC family methyltransferase [Helicobacter canadensis]EES90003.1 protoporphyrinogen oxidase [Helicobacter canadensis MIT 98-5491]EFR49151.1 methyltransferase, HemK family [Helicobacter canadensis MIT 98-5491]STP02498.1 protoporphyrinogen oxidase [Helicobacter canadensis]